MLHPAIRAATDGDIHGVSLVTTEKLNAGEVVWVLDEPIYSWAEVQSWDAERREAYDWYGFQCGVDQYSLPEGLSREMNHSCDANLGWKGSITLVAMRDIEAGAEITYDYSTCEVDHPFEMDCTCGSPRCRKRVTNLDFLDPEFQLQYRGFLPPHVLAAIEQERQ